MKVAHQDEEVIAYEKAKSQESYRRRAAWPKGDHVLKRWNGWWRKGLVRKMFKDDWFCSSVFLFQKIIRNDEMKGFRQSDGHKLQTQSGDKFHETILRIISSAIVPVRWTTCSAKRTHQEPLRRLRSPSRWFHIFDLRWLGWSKVVTFILFNYVVSLF